MINTGRISRCSDFDAVATFTAADRELWIARFVVNVSMLPGTTIVPKLPTSSIRTHSLAVSDFTRPQLRHIPTVTTLALHNSRLSDTMGLHRAASSYVTTAVRAAFRAVYRDIPT